MGAGVSAATPPQTLRQAILGTRNPGGGGGSRVLGCGAMLPAEGLVLVRLGSCKDPARRRSWRLGKGGPLGTRAPPASLCGEGAGQGGAILKILSVKYPVYISSMCFLTRFRDDAVSPAFHPEAVRAS